MTAIAQHADDVRLRRLQRRQQPEQQDGPERHRNQRAGDRRIHLVVDPIRQCIRGNERGEDSDAGHRERQADQASKRGQERAFGEQLCEDARAAGAKGASDCELTHSLHPAREHQVGDVGARHDQDEKP
jgi:hypothetical protein